MVDLERLGLAKKSFPTGNKKQTSEKQAPEAEQHLSREERSAQKEIRAAVPELLLIHIPGCSILSSVPRAER